MSDFGSLVTDTSFTGCPNLLNGLKFSPFQVQQGLVVYSEGQRNEISTADSM